MKTIYLLLVLNAFVQVVCGQSYVTVYMDYGHLAAQTKNLAERMTSEVLLNNAASNSYSNIKRVEENAAKLLAAKMIIHHSLVEVNSLFKTGPIVIYMGKLVTNIINSTDQLTTLASQHPEYIPFATKVVTETKIQVLNLTDYIYNFVLKGGKEAMMSHSQRDLLFNEVISRLRLIRATIDTMYHSIYWASMKSFWQNISPFDSWINLDRDIINRITNQVQLFNK